MSSVVQEPTPPSGDTRPVIQVASLPEAVQREIRRRILNNEYPAGERLLESRLAEEFGVSRTTLRSALRYLASENLVEITQRRGCFVARMNEQEVHDSCYARYLLESGAATLNLAWISDEIVSELENELQRMVRAALDGDLARIVDSDTAFHSIVVSASGLARVTELWHHLDGQMGSLMRSSFDQQGIDMTEIVNRHQVVIDAVKTRDPDVIARAIKDHYLTRDVESEI